MRTGACFVCTGLIAALIGCGGSGLPKTVHLGGTVNLDGKPLTNVLVIFSSADKDGAPQIFAQVDNGRFSAPHVPLGKYRVTFRPTDFLNLDPNAPVGSDAGSKMRESKSPLPEKYREQPFKTIDATADDLTLKFDLMTK